MCRRGESASALALGEVVDHSCFEQREAGVGAALQQCHELGMGACEAGENIVARGSRERDAAASAPELG